MTLSQSTAPVTSVPAAQVPSLHFLPSNVASSTLILISAPLRVVVGVTHWNRHVPPTGIDCYKREVGGADMLALIKQIVLDEYLHADFHRSVEHTIHGGAQDYKIAHVNRCPKIQMIDGCSHNIISRMAVGGHRASQVDPVHQASTE